jgi:hypothetical protein
MPSQKISQNLHRKEVNQKVSWENVKKDTDDNTHILLHFFFFFLKH